MTSIIRRYNQKDNSILLLNIAQFEAIKRKGRKIYFYGKYKEVAHNTLSSVPYMIKYSAEDKAITEFNIIQETLTKYNNTIRVYGTILLNLKCFEAIKVDGPYLLFSGERIKFNGIIPETAPYKVKLNSDEEALAELDILIKMWSLN